MERDVLSSLLRIDRQRRRALKCALAPCRYLGVMHLIVLYISRAPGASQEEIASFYALDKTSVARDARRLEDLGHIERKTTPEDRRQYQLFLTPAGRDMIQVIHGAMDQFRHALFAGVPPEDQERLAALLKQLERNVYPDS